MKLYDIPRGTHFRLLSEQNVPPGAPNVNVGEIYWLGNVDGMHSYCKDSEGNVVHIFAAAEVELV